MQSLKLYLDHKIRSKENFVQNNKTIDKTFLNMSSSDHMVPIKFTETIKDVLQIHVAFNT